VRLDPRAVNVAGATGAPIAADLRVRVRLRGLVQGVGFRPFVAAIARQHHIGGWVCNDSEGVLLEAEGAQLHAFLDALAAGPPGARVDSIDIEPRPREGSAAFRIAPSPTTGHPLPSLGADLAPCRACLGELFDPTSRRWRYALLSCASCGPRDSIALGLPWDRARTTLAAFGLCAACDAEFHDPADRRFHAQSIACPACGPVVDADFVAAAAALTAGGIVALKAIGGYQLLCLASDPAAVAALRRRKGRGDKPFAVLVRNLASAEAWVELDDAARESLSSPRRPIVLARARRSLEGVAPGLDQLGVMLPSNPLHWLLLHALAGQPSGTRWLDEPELSVLVATSANPAGEPLWGDESHDRLRTLAHVVLGHGRPIAQLSDDSVLQVAEGAPRLVRRARGFAPESVLLPGHGILALGAERKGTVSLLHHGHLCTSPHLGDLDDMRTLGRFREAIDRFCRMYGAQPTLVAHDLHPDFLSTRHAESLGVPTLGVQHHHAHVAAVLAEHGRRGPALGIVLDGYGYGEDGAAWGGELLEVDGATCRRVGHLAPLPMPGGDVAAHEPWRMAVAVLYRLGRREEVVRRWGEPGARVWALCERGQAPLTTSAGRAFDAAAALAGLGGRATYEGELALRLQAHVRQPRAMQVPIAPVLDLLPLFAAFGDTPEVSAAADLFHGSLARALVAWAGYSQLETVVLGGGCFANPILTALLADGLRAAGREPLLARRFPSNDGAISVGQAAIASWS
jgi:hydrogenase maturation protein HypF